MLPGRARGPRRRRARHRRRSAVGWRRSCWGAGAGAGTGAGARAGVRATTASGLKYLDVRIGDGPSPEAGDTVQVHYTGQLYQKRLGLGEVFDSSRGTNFRQLGQPLQFKIGKGEVIKGWDEGLLTMRVGGKRNLIVPPSL